MKLTLPNYLRTFLLAVLIIAVFLAVGYWNFERRPEATVDRPIAVAAIQTIDFFLTNSHTLQFQEDGSVRYELRSKQLDHLKHSDQTLLTQPDLLLVRGTEYPWHITGDKGEVAAEGKEIELIDNVRVARTDAKQRPTILQTTRLTYFPDDEIAQTQQPVEIEAANGITHATGMKIYFKDSVMHLHSNVRGQHEVR